MERKINCKSTEKNWKNWKKKDSDLPCTELVVSTTRDWS
jgi:hypothetical protein